MQRSYKNWALSYKSLRIKTMNEPMYNTKKPARNMYTVHQHCTTLLLGFMHTGADPFWICSRLGPIHTGPVCTALVRIRPKGVRMQNEAIHAYEAWWRQGATIWMLAIACCYVGNYMILPDWPTVLVGICRKNFLQELLLSWKVLHCNSSNNVEHRCQICKKCTDISCHNCSSSWVHIAMLRRGRI